MQGSDAGWACTGAPTGAPLDGPALIPTAARCFAKAIQKPTNAAVIILEDEVGSAGSSARANLVESDSD